MADPTGWLVHSKQDSTVKMLFCYRRLSMRSSPAAIRCNGASLLLLFLIGHNFLPPAAASSTAMAAAANPSPASSGRELLSLVITESMADYSPCKMPSDQRSIVNYLALHACVLDSRPWLSVPVLLALVAFFFYILAHAAGNYFSPVVGRLAEMMRLTASTGGVTLLALGNGAPDFFASIAAVWGDNARMGLGAIVSAGLFVSAFVVGFVALAAAPFPLKPLPFIRDVCFYILAASLMFCVYLSGKVRVWQSSGLVLLYLVFVITVFAMDQAPAKAESFSSAARPKADPQEEDATPVITTLQKKQCAPPTPGGMYDGESRIQVFDVEESVPRQEIKASRNLLSVLVGLIASVLCSDRRDCSVCKQALKIRLLWQLPVEVALRSTIPAVDLSNWNRIYASANLVFCPLIFLYIIGSAISPFRRMVFLVPGLNPPLWFIILLQGSILGAVHFIITKEQPRTEQPIATATAFVMSVFWISMVAGELLGCLAALGTILKVPSALLGLTVLAWGNSIGDLVADVAVARAGQPAMAMAGCFAGPMFNMLVGFGIALTMKSARMHPAPYLLDYNPSIVVAFGFLFVSLLGSLLVVILSKFIVPRFWGFCLISLYIIFVITSVLNTNML